jgi:glycosyltransferase involved in cell wall biosynthesis
MQICIWFDTLESGSGGSNSFIKSLTNELRKMGHSVTNKPSATDDVILLNSWSRGRSRYINLSEFAHVRSKGSVSSISKWIPKSYWKGKAALGPPTVHRVDGVAKLYGRNDPKADQTQFSIASEATHVVFQSNYSQQSFAQFGILPAKSTIILNGVDGDIFYPTKEKQTQVPSKIKLVANSWSMNPFKGFDWLPKVANHPRVEISFIGRWLQSVDPGKVKLLGPKLPNEIGAILREADAFIHAAKNDPCPNVVQEALASGLPVIYQNSGGTSELASDFGVPLSPDIDQVIDALFENFVLLREKVRQERLKFLISRAAREYADVFDQVVRAKL